MQKYWCQLIFKVQTLLQYLTIQIAFSLNDFTTKLGATFLGRYNIMVKTDFTAPRAALRCRLIKHSSMGHTTDQSHDFLGLVFASSF